jgi:hypothetical protein
VVSAANPCGRNLGFLDRIIIILIIIIIIYEMTLFAVLLNVEDRFF